MLGQELAGFEFLIAVETFPDLFLLGAVLVDLLHVLDQGFDLLPQQSHVVFADPLRPLLRPFLNLFEHSLHLLQLLVICLHPQKGSTNFHGKDPLILKGSPTKVIIGMHLSEVQQIKIHLFVETGVLSVKKLVFVYSDFLVKFLYQFLQGDRIFLQPRSGIVLENFHLLDLRR